MNAPQQSGEDVTRRTFGEVMVPVFSPSEVVPVRGSGLDLWDQAGRHFLDLTAGIGVTGMGHVWPPAVHALREQAERLWHCGNVFTNEPVLRLARALVDACFAERAFFCNSGAEANEAALKLARIHAQKRFGPHKSRIVSCLNAFHGRTLFTVSVGGQSKYTEGFEPLPPAIEHIPFNDKDAARAAMGEDVCALVVEPIQGEGGVQPADPAWLLYLRELCDVHGALLIFDEVQCGMGRTGDLFAYMGYGVTPDILTSAKALGNGFPIGAMLTTEAIAMAFTPGTHGSTYGGNPLAATVALTVLQAVSQPAFLARVRDAGRQLAFRLEAIVKAHPDMFYEVRGKGLMLGVVMADGWRGRARDVVFAAEEEGVLVLTAGPNVVRLLPALVISDVQIEEAGQRLQRAVERLLTT